MSQDVPNRHSPATIARPKLAACENIALAVLVAGLLIAVGARPAMGQDSQPALTLEAPAIANTPRDPGGRTTQPPAVRRPVVVAIRQPDEPRTPLAQPPQLPAPAEGIPAPGSTNVGINPPSYGNTGLPPIGSLTINIVPAAGPVPREVDPTRTLETEFGPTEFRREPLFMDYRWEAPAFFNRPLYFEQPNLERYGYDWGVGQFFISGAQFLVKIPLLPYMMTVHCPNEPIYSLGYYRPGSRAPYQINWPDVRLDASIVEATFIVGLVFLIP